MDINLLILGKYCSKYGSEVNFSIDCESSDATLIVIKGSHPEGGRREYIDFRDLLEILIVNNIVGENSLVKSELDAFKKEMNDGTGNRFRRIEKKEELIYGTLAKYIAQLIDAAMGRIFYPEIIPLEKHKNYFRNTAPN